MHLYDVTQLEKELDLIAENNEGEVPEEKYKELVEASTAADVSLEKMIKYIKHLEHFIEASDNEMKRLKENKDRAKARIESIKRYMTPFVLIKDGYTVGTFKLSTRRSTQVHLKDDFNIPEYITIKEVIQPDKMKIKDDLTNGVVIEGATLVEKDNLQIK